MDKPMRPKKMRSLPWARVAKTGGIKKGRLQPPRGRALTPRGPRVLGIGLIPILVGGPDSFVRRNGALFATGTTSRDEGYFYWALATRLGPEGQFWSFQVPVGGGRHVKGGSVVDFIINYNPNKEIGVRIVTFRFHLTFGSGKHATDVEQVFSMLNNDIEVMDVYSQDYIGDRTGKAVLRVLDAVLAGNQQRNPLATAGVIAR